MSLKIKFAATPAQSPPIVWLIIAFPVICGHFRADIIPTCVLRYPLQHIHIAVNTAISFAWTVPAATISVTSPIAAPAAPRAVIGTATADTEENPNSGVRIKSIFSPSQGRRATPSYAAPVYVPSAEGPFVSIITSVQITSTPGIIARPTSTPFFPPSSRGSRRRPPPFLRK